MKKKLRNTHPFNGRSVGVLSCYYLPARQWMAAVYQSKNAQTRRLPMSNTLLDPKNDFVFKKLFVNAPDLLADLINAVRSDEDPVEVIDILNPQIEPEELTGKFILLDVLARDSRGRLFNIEMQVRRLAEWIERSLYYIASAYAGQLKKGGDYATLKPVIGINLLDFDLFGGRR